MKESDQRMEGASAGEGFDRLFPYHAELCALSELRKTPGFGAAVRSGMGGHSLLYLNGVSLDRDAGYPVLRVVAPEASPGRHGAGVSVNSHYRNANWIAVEGRSWLWHGTRHPGTALTREAYEQTQQEAKRRGLLDGVEFHEHLFRDRPAGMSVRDYMYEISVATDYAVCFGRDVYRARVPLDHARMLKIVDYLNEVNAPYRAGQRIFTWKLFNDNCAHVAHNALAAAGVWAAWPTGRSAALAMFNFPVPKNEFVDLMLCGNDLPLGRPDAMFDDKPARRALFESGALAAEPGRLAVKTPALRDNEVYDTQKLKLIFYDNPFWGPYRFRFARIFREPRYHDLRANFAHFAAAYASAARGGQPLCGERARFQALYDIYVAAAAARLAALQRRLDETAVRREVVS